MAGAGGKSLHQAVHMGMIDTPGRMLLVFFGHVEMYPSVQSHGRELPFGLRRPVRAAGESSYNFV